MLGIIGPILGGYQAEIMSPLAFLARPARWVQWLATKNCAFSAAPNFAFELAVRKTTDEDMAGLDLGSVLTIVTGSERVHPATLKRFVNRFAPHGFREHMITPSYGMAEATVYVATRAAGGAPVIVDFDLDKLAVGTAERCAPDAGSPLISYGVPHSPAVRIVVPDACKECPAGAIGEIWVSGDNVSRVTGTSRRRPSARSAARSSTRHLALPRGPGCAPVIWASCPTPNSSSWAASRTC